MNTDKSQPRLAATVVVVRDAPEGLQVLLLQRAERGDHNSGAWVFPGGLVDAADRAAHAHCEGRSDAEASALLGVQAGGLDHFVAAIRECFEEAGLLFADAVDGRAFDLQGEAGQRLSACRDALNRGERDMSGLCREFGLRLRADHLHYIAHWLTPAGRAKRFDTRFFLAVLPEGQSSAHDDVETVQQIWINPAQALAAENTRRLMTPTRAVIRQLAAFENCAALLAWARSPRVVERVLPRLALGAAGPLPVLPWQPAWAEIGRLDPEGRGDAWCELRPGVPVDLAPGVRRLSATDGRGNSYLLACGSDACAFIDPGPADPAHLDALVSAATGPIRWICLCDGDAEQSKAATALQARTGAQVCGPASTGADLPPGLRALPGSAGSVSYLLDTEGLLFTGASTPGPEVLAAHTVAWLAPRQGFLRAIAHAREAQT
jgi:8-oxo-dGTP pyrophosphatase MutT (NUDIX family)